MKYVLKPHVPRITTTAEELRGKSITKAPVTVSGVPLDPTAIVYLVVLMLIQIVAVQKRDQIPSNYSKIASEHPDGVHTTLTIPVDQYTVFCHMSVNKLKQLFITIM